VTWGGPTSLVDVWLSPGDGGATVVELEHTVPVELAGSGAGALYVGPGWDVSVPALAGLLRGDVVADPVAWENSLEVQRFSAGSIAAWAEVAPASGTATAEEISTAAEMSDRLPHLAERPSVTGAGPTGISWIGRSPVVSRPARSGTAGRARGS
jgi:hypothetical protein